MPVPSDRSAYDPVRYASLDGYAADVLAICAALELQDVMLVGHSVSSPWSVLAVDRRTIAFRDLVLVTPSPRYLDDRPTTAEASTPDIDGLLQMIDINTMGWAAFLAPVVMGNPDRPELSADLEATFCSIDPVMARQFAQVTFLADNRADLRECHDAVADHRMLPGRGRADGGRPPTSTSHLATARLRVIDATGHCPHVSHPAETIDAIRDYLADRGAHAPVGELGPDRVPGVCSRCRATSGSCPRTAMGELVARPPAT